MFAPCPVSFFPCPILCIGYYGIRLLLLPFSSPTHVGQEGWPTSTYSTLIFSTMLLLSCGHAARVSNDDTVKQNKIKPSLRTKITVHYYYMRTILLLLLLLFRPLSSSGQPRRGHPAISWSLVNNHNYAPGHGIPLLYSTLTTMVSKQVRYACVYNACAVYTGTQRNRNYRPVR